jgi:hypothetical protein
MRNFVTYIPCPIELEQLNHEGWAWHIACIGENADASRVSVEKSEGKRSL